MLIQDACRVFSIEKNFGYMGIELKPQIFSAQCRAQVTVCGRCPQAISGSYLIEAGAVHYFGVIVLVQWNLKLLGSPQIAIAKRVYLLSGIRYGLQTTGATQRVCSARPVLHFFKQRAYALPVPAWRVFRPVIVVQRVAANIDHRINGA